MSEYLIMLYEDESGYANSTPEQLQDVMTAHTRFREQVAELGAQILSGRALQPTTTATSVQADAVTDGPFVETKENLGGFYLIDAKDLDQALAMAKLVPAPFGGVEVRPIMVSDVTDADDAVADAHRREWAFVLAATARVAGDLDLAEECVQDAYLAALDSWRANGVPTNPAAWLTTAARRRAVDAQRRAGTLRAKLPLLVVRRGEPEREDAVIDRTTGCGWCSRAATRRWRWRPRWH